MKAIAFVGIFGVLGVAALLAVQHVHAGQRDSLHDVVVQAQAAWGVQSEARNRPDPNQVVGCLASSFVGSTSFVCVASDRFTPYPNLSAACTQAAGMPAYGIFANTSDDLIYFTWDNSGACTEVDAIVNSIYPPKVFYPLAP